MKTITRVKNSSAKLALLSVAFVVGSIAVFGVLPLLPNTHTDVAGPTLEASVAEAASVKTDHVSVCSRYMSHNGCVTEDSDTFKAPFAGTYTLKARERRGADTSFECQGNEDYKLYVNGKYIGTSKDPSSCEEQGTKTNKNFGKVNLKAGKNTVKIVHAKQSSSGNAESVGATFTFTAPDPVQNPTCDSFTASKKTLPVGGGNVTLAWNTSHADSVKIDSGIGPVSSDGSKIVSISDTTKYTLTASNSASSDTCSVTVNVNTDVPAIDIVKRDNADKDDTLNIGQGDTATFEIKVTNTGNIDLKDVIVTDPKESNCNKSIDTLASGATHSYTCSTSDVQSNFTNTAQVTGTPIGGGTNVSDSDSANVVVKKEEKSNLTCDLRSSESRVNRGSTFTLIWDTEGATDVSIDRGIGGVTPDGSRNRSIDQDTTYTLTATDGDNTITCKTTVRINTGGSGGGGGGNPYCRFSADKKEITAGEDVVLSWNNGRTNDITLEDNRGNLLIDTDRSRDEDIDEDKDSFTVNPTRDTTYILTAIRGDDEDVCEVDITVEEDDVTVTSTRTQEPLVRGISLTSVPYTGFDSGKALEMGFYTLLAVWTIGVLYTLARRKPMIEFTDSTKH